MKKLPRFILLTLTTVLLLAPLSASASTQRVSVNLHDAELHNVFRLLAQVGGVNIVVADEVKGHLTIKVRNVPWRQLMDVVLHQKGLVMERLGSIYYVDTMERSAMRADLAFKAQEAKRKSAPLRTVLIPVRYALAKDLAPIVRSMLSERGRVQVDERTNVLIVTDIDERTDAIRSATR